MLNIKYHLTPALLSNINKSERLYGQLEALKIPQKLQLNLQRDNLIQSSYVSNSIEGNPLSEHDVTNLLLGEKIPTNRDEKEVTNYFEILSSLKDYLKTPLSLELMNRFHYLLLNGVNDQIAGKVRNKRVVIGKYLDKDKSALSLKVKHEPPFHRTPHINSALNRLFAWFDQSSDLPVILRTGIFHHHFVFIHPYVDGNGRVCRLLTALLFLKNHYLINKYFVLDDYYDIDRLQYSDKLHTADSGDKTEWLEYFSEGVMYSLQASLARVKEALFQLKVEERPTAREKQVLDLILKQREMTSADLVKDLKISRQQAHNLLKALVTKGFITKQGKTKLSYYSLK